MYDDSTFCKQTENLLLGFRTFSKRTILENNKWVYSFIRDLRVIEANLFSYKKIKIIPNNK